MPRIIQGWVIKQVMLRIGFLGPKGTFSHEALLKYSSGADNIHCDYNSIPEILSALQQDQLDEAIVPIENSLEGAVNATLDMMASDVDLMIKSELIIPVRQNLLVKMGVQLDRITAVLSHPQPIGQCRGYLTTCLKHAEVRLVYSTAAAAAEVAAGDGTSAAIGSSAAAGVYGLEVAASDIQDCENNHTRFAVIAKADSTRTGKDKTSIVFSTENKPGSLYRVLDIFNLWDINLLRIESRPAKDQLGRYIFFVDIEGHREDGDVRDAITMVKRKASFFKFLGSYPVYGLEEAGMASGMCNEGK